MTPPFRALLATAAAVLASVLGDPARAQDAAPAGTLARRQRAHSAQAGDLRRRRTIRPPPSQRASRPRSTSR